MDSPHLEAGNRVKKVHYYFADTSFRNLPGIQDLAVPSRVMPESYRRSSPVLSRSIAVNGLRTLVTEGEGSQAE